MRHIHVDRLNSLEYEINMLAGGLRGVGMGMSELGENPDGQDRAKELADIGYLMVSTSLQLEKIAADMNASLARLEESK